VSRLTQIQFDPQTLARAGQGDRCSQATIYEAIGPAVFALVRRLVADRATAEDLFQDSLMAVFEHLPQFRGEAPFGAWVRRIVVSRCFMHLRSPWQRARQTLADFGAEDEWPAALHAGGRAAADPATQMDLSRALARLPALTRAIVWLHDVEGLTHEEIAQAFGRSSSFSKSQLARAHRALQSMLASPGEPACRALTAQLKVVT
jgi:RNA polymerase sigma-70 factor (ECF subfamily)